MDTKPCEMNTVKTRINGVRSGFFYFFFVLGDVFFGVFFRPFPEEEISDDIAHDLFIRVFTVDKINKN